MVSTSEAGEQGETGSQTETKPDKQGPAIKWADFLTSTPPDVTKEISDLLRLYQAGRSDLVNRRPDLLLHCDSEQCQGLRFHECKEGVIFVKPDKWEFGFIRYQCRNCQSTVKTYAVAMKRSTGMAGYAYKFGELPPFGPPTPARVITLIGPDRELFLQGRRAESRGFGIGAFTYYRRVVVNQKTRIILSIKKVAERLGADPKVLEVLQKAADETQFTTALDNVKTALPEALLIREQNPLTLLHNALSRGLHAKTDEECLSLAQDIRIVLTELADRISQALKDDAELTEAVNRLASIKTEATTDEA